MNAYTLINGMTRELSNEIARIERDRTDHNAFEDFEWTLERANSLLRLITIAIEAGENFSKCDINARDQLAERVANGNRIEGEIHAQIIEAMRDDELHCIALRAGIQYPSKETMDALRAAHKAGENGEF